ncbi:hypothetical protein YC2023_040342 [Brassica napus]
MKPQVVTTHKIFSDANMPPNFDEIDEKEGSNDDSDGEDHIRFNLESPMLLKSVTDDGSHYASRRVSLNEGQGSSQNSKTFGMIGYTKSPSYLNSNEKILIGVATKGGKQGFACSEVSECFKVKRSLM